MLIFTDGACSGNPGKGAWAWVLKHNSQYKAFYNTVNYTTNNQMEMQAVIEALKFIHEQKLTVSIIIYTDSRYVHDGLLVWLPNWKKKNWINSAKQAVKNKDMWMEIDPLFNSLENVSIEWVKGHSNNEGNNIADQVAACSVHNPSHESCSCKQYF